MQRYNELKKAFNKARLDRNADRSGFLSVLIGQAQNDGIDRAQDPDAMMLKILQQSEKSLLSSLQIENTSETYRANQTRDLAVVREFLPQKATGEQMAAKLEHIIGENPDKMAQAKERPALRGWFIGQVTKAFDGAVDVELLKAMIDRRFS